MDRVKENFTYHIASGPKAEVVIAMGDNFYSLAEISGLILDEVREAAQNYLNEEVSRAVVTVPAYFNDLQRQAVREAGKLIDLDIIRILNEPTSAALAYGFGKGLNKKVLLVHTMEPKFYNGKYFLLAGRFLFSIVSP